MRKMSFSDKERNKSNIQALVQALSRKDNSTINTGTVQAPKDSESKDNTWSGAGSALGGAFKLGKSLYDSGLFNQSSTTETPNFGVIGQAADNYVSGNTGSDFGTIGNAANNYITTGASSGGSAIGNAINSEAGSGLGSSMGGGGFNGMGLIAPAIGGLQGYAKTGDWQGGVQGMFGVDEDDSDVMQSINGAKNGAMTGFSVGGPWGAAIGGVLGLASSFIDDI